MSRCFPFPPIGYSAKIAASDTLIDSIKLRRETKKDASAESKKERKREKKEKKERKLREKQEANVLDQSRKRKHDDKLATDSKLSKGNNGSKNDDSELLERSNITEEYGQPYCPQIPCTSDSSEDSNRRKRHCQNPPLETGISAQGNILRIRLAPKKPETPIAVVPLKTKEELEQPMSTVKNQVELRQPKEPSSSGRIELTSLDKKLRRVDLVYTGLFENWVPSSLSSVEDDDLGWLNEKKVSQNEQPKSGVHNSCIFNTTNLWQPQAIFLPEVEVYALPFTVPF